MNPRALPAALLGIALAGCGLKGPLALPEKAGPVTIRPASGATEPATEPAKSSAPEKVDESTVPAAAEPEPPRE